MTMKPQAPPLAPTSPSLSPSPAPCDDANLPWDARIRQLIDFGIDETLIIENLRRTPDERLRRMMDMVQFVEEHQARATSRP